MITIRFDIRQDSEFAIRYGYPKSALKRGPDTDPDIQNAFIDISRIQTFGKSCTLHNHSFMLQASLPVTTYYCTENKLAEIPSSLRQPEQIQKDYSQSKLIIRSADLTDNGYPRTLTSSQPSDNVIKNVSRSHKTSSGNQMRLIMTRKRWRNRRENPSTDKHLKVLEAFEISQSAGDSISNSQLEHLK